MLSAHVPRNLRVRSSIQLASTRVPARAFLIAAGLIFAGGLAVVAGADLAATARRTAALILIGLAVFELRLWGRSTREVARILARHYRRPRQLRFEPVVLALPADPEELKPIDRSPRWHHQD